MVAFMTNIDTWSHGNGATGAILRIVLRFIQFVLAITVAGLYGVDLKNASDAGSYIDGKWVFAEVVAGLSAFTCLVYAIPFIKSYLGFGWDFVLFVLWTALFGLFASIYLDAEPTPRQGGQIRMKHAVWVDLVNMLLWFITTVYSSLLVWKSRGARTLHTGAAKA